MEEIKPEETKMPSPFSSESDDESDDESRASSDFSDFPSRPLHGASFQNDDQNGQNVDQNGQNVDQNGQIEEPKPWMRRDSLDTKGHHRSRSNLIGFREVNVINTSFGMRIEETFKQLTLANFDGPLASPPPDLSEEAQRLEDRGITSEKLELEFLALSLFERGRLQLDHFEPSNRNRTMTQDFVEGLPEEKAPSAHSFFKISTFASKVMRLFAKNLASDYLVNMLRGPLVTMSMEIEGRFPSGARIDIPSNIPLIESMCDTILNCIISQRSSFPLSLASLCKFVYLKVYDHDPSKVTAAVALIQLGSYNLIPPKIPFSSTMKGVLLIIAKVLQKLAEGAYFEITTTPELVPLNEFIERNQEAVHRYICSFSEGYEQIPVSLNVDPNDMGPLLSVLVTKIRSATNENSDLQLMYNSLPAQTMRSIQLLLTEKEGSIHTPFLEILVDPSMDLVSVLCAISDIGSQTDSVTEAIIVAFDTLGKATSLFEWVLLDEIQGGRRTAKKRVAPKEKTNGVIRAGPLLYPIMARVTKGNNSRLFWQQRWALLTSTHLQVFKSQTTLNPFLQIPMIEARKIPVKNLPGAGENKLYTFEVNTANFNLKLAVEDDIKRYDWINDINEIIRNNKSTVKTDARSGFSNYVSDRRVEARQLNSAGCAMMDVSVFGIKKEGELVKKGGKRKNWKRRYFVLEQTFLSYYAKAKDQNPLGILALEQCHQVSVSKQKELCIELHMNHRIYYLQCQSEEEFQEWLNPLRRVVDHFRGT